MSLPSIISESPLEMGFFLVEGRTSHFNKERTVLGEYRAVTLRTLGVCVGGGGDSEGDTRCYRV